MIEREIQFQKKRELGEIISDSFEFIKQEFRSLGKLILQYVLPFILLYGGLQVYVQMKVFTSIDFSDSEWIFSNLGPLYMNILLSSLFAVFVQALLIGTYYSYIVIYIKKGKNNFTLEDISAVLFPNTLKALGASFVVYFLVLIGVIMCVLPGIYFANSLSPLVMVLLFEKKSIAHALSRTWKLVHTDWWNTFVLNLLGVVIIYVAGFIVTLPGMLFGQNNMVPGGQQAGATDFSAWYWIIVGLSTIVSALFWIVPFTFLAFQYFNLRERNEPTLAV